VIDHPGEIVYVIWSFEHHAWWRPDWNGYTVALADAGRYTEPEADEILARANIVRCHEVAVVEREASAFTPQLLRLGPLRFR
jgi:hypothetical protein